MNFIPQSFRKLSSNRQTDMINSSVATGGEGHAPPTVDRHGHRIRANPRIFLEGKV